MDSNPSTSSRPPVGPPDVGAPPLDDYTEPPKWPKVVGTISIVWGALSLTCGGCSVAMMLFTPQMMKMGEQQFGPAPAVMLPSIPQLVLGVLGTLWIVLLLIAGIMTVSRSPAGRGMHLLWAVGALVLGVVGVGLGIRQQLAIQAWASHNQGNQWAQQQNPALAMVMMAVMVVVTFAWPIFCLIWFGAVKRTAESMTGGENPV